MTLLMQRRMLFVPLTAFALSAGCATETNCGESDCGDTGSEELAYETAADLDERAAAKSHWEGTPEGVGVIEFLNDEATTYNVLDREVPLDRRAAGNLIAHRDGGDRQWGTTDDDVYGSLDEVDAVRFVGKRSIDRLVRFASQNGWVPGAKDLLGIYDGVSFTVAEADATVAFVNALDEVQLDDDLGLDIRAVRSIMAAQPIETIDELSRLYYVGRGALSAAKTAGVAEDCDTSLFIANLLRDVTEYYAKHSEDIAAHDGKSLAEALSSVNEEGVSAVEFPDDPRGYDSATHVVLQHTDVIFDGEHRVWFGACERMTQARFEIYNGG